MELHPSVQQLKESLGALAKSRLLHISEAAEQLKVTEHYLTDLVKSGKLKAFKVGEHWFVESDWVEDFRRGMHGLIKSEIGELYHRPHGQGWVKPIGKRRSMRLPRLRLPAMSLPAFTLPKFNWPKLALPEIRLPALRFPSLAWPKAFKKKISLPRIAWPKIALPKILFKRISWPKLSWPRIRLPKFSLPKLSAPRIAWPKFVLPKRAIAPAKIRSVGQPRPKMKFSVPKANLRRLFGAFRLPKIRIELPKIDFSPIFGLKKYSIAVLKGAAASVALSLIVAAFSFLCLPLASFGINRTAAASVFLTATFRAYSMPGETASRLASALPINDENLTHQIYRLAGKNPPGRVAGAYAYKLAE